MKNIIQVLMRLCGIGKDTKYNNAGSILSLKGYPSKTELIWVV